MPTCPRLIEVKVYENCLRMDGAYALFASVTMLRSCMNRKLMVQRLRFVKPVKQPLNMVRLCKS
jgi:hypothetical protein